MDYKYHQLSSHEVNFNWFDNWDSVLTMSIEIVDCCDGWCNELSAILGVFVAMSPLEV